MSMIPINYNRDGYFEYNRFVSLDIFIYTWTYIYSYVDIYILIRGHINTHTLTYIYSYVDICILIKKRETEASVELEEKLG